MSQNSIAGYLVVAQDPLPSGTPANYRGVNRMPPYVLAPDPPEFPEEAEALDAYVFGDYKEENCNDLIPTLSRAKELIDRFRNSRRKYEIIFISNSETPPKGVRARELGFDVATCEGEWYSIAQEFPLNDDRFASLRAGLNEFRLFKSVDFAKAYLTKYIELQMPDWDMSPWGIVRVWAVDPSPGPGSLQD